jgi:hypothetical protein
MREEAYHIDCIIMSDHRPMDIFQFTNPVHQARLNLLSLKNAIDCLSDATYQFNSRC